MITLTPRLYIASLKDYNNEKLYGVWVDADQPPELILREINLMLKNSKFKNAEEWRIDGFENFGDFEVSEFDSLNNISKLAFLIIEHGEIFADFVNYQGEFTENSEENFLESYVGLYDSKESFSMIHFDTTYPNTCIDSLYIDYEMYMRDLFCESYIDFKTANNQVAIFRMG